MPEEVGANKAAAPAIRSSARRGLSAQSLAREIFRADVPEEFVRSLPAESLYLAVKHNGLASSADVIDIATLDQCRLLLDLDCWSGDRFREESFWDWLGLADEDHGLRLLQKFVKFVDLKLIGILIARHVEHRVFEEPTENPPGAGFYTPDKGHTWISIRSDDADKHFLLGRLLALLFETDPDLFYQLLSMPNIATETMLEEESYQDRSRRLRETGIPSAEEAAEFATPMSEREAQEKMATLDESMERQVPAQEQANVEVIEPLVFSRGLIFPLALLAEDQDCSEYFAAELSCVINAALVHYHVDFSEMSALQELGEKVKGAINIGIEAAMRLSQRDAVSCFRSLRTRGLFRLGLGKLAEIKKAAKSVSSRCKSGELDAAQHTTLDGLLQRFPMRTGMLAAAAKDGTETTSSNENVPLQAPFQYLREIEQSMEFLRARFPI